MEPQYNDDYSLFVKAHNRLAPVEIGARDSVITISLKNLSKYYNYVSLHWYNISPDLSNASFKTFNTVDSTLASTHSFLYGLRASYNYFRKYTGTNQYIYWLAGVGLRKINNLEELDKFSYKKSTEIKTKDNELLSNDETGTAYSGKYKDGAEWDAFVEGYWTPSAKVFIPGFYFKLQYSNGAAWVNKDKISTDFGLIYNITSSDKDAKNILSIIPYASFSNILTQHDLTNLTRNVPLHDLFTIGFKVGIPINVGK